jgi:hypothetical protein
MRAHANLRAQAHERVGRTLGHPSPGQHVDKGYNPAVYQRAVGNTAQALTDWEAHHPAAMAGRAPVPGWVSRAMAKNFGSGSGGLPPHSIGSQLFPPHNLRNQVTHPVGGIGSPVTHPGFPDPFGEAGGQAHGFGPHGPVTQGQGSPLLNQLKQFQAPPLAPSAGGSGPYRTPEELAALLQQHGQFPGGPQHGPSPILPQLQQHALPPSPFQHAAQPLLANGLVHLGQGLFLHPITGEIHGFGPTAAGAPPTPVPPGPQAV